MSMACPVTFVYVDNEPDPCLAITNLPLYNLDFIGKLVDNEPTIMWNQCDVLIFLFDWES